MAFSLISCARPAQRTPVIPTPARSTELPSPTTTPTARVSPTPTIVPTNTPRPTPGPSLGDFIEQAEALVQEQQYDAALNALPEMKRLYPDRADPWLLEAEIAGRTASDTTQLDLLRSAIEAEPGNALAYLALVDVYAALDQLLISNVPQNAVSADILNVAAQSYAVGDYRQVVEITSDGLQDFPESEGLHTARGLAYWSLSDLEAATDDLRVATQLDFDDPYLLLLYGQALTGAGDAGSAIDALRTASRAARQQGGFYASIEYLAIGEEAVVAAQMNLETAYDELGDEVFEVGSIDPYILAYARIDLMLQQYDLAIFRLFDLVDSGYVPALYYLGVAYEQTAQRDLATDAYTRYLDQVSFGPLAAQAEQALDRLQ